MSEKVFNQKNKDGRKQQKSGEVVNHERGKKGKIIERDKNNNLLENLCLLENSDLIYGVCNCVCVYASVRDREIE